MTNSALRAAEFLRTTKTDLEKRRVSAPTVFMVGSFFGKPRLSLLRSENGFKPELRDGPEFAGTGGRELKKEFLANLDFQMRSWDERARLPVFEVVNGEPRKLADVGTEPFPVTLLDLANTCGMSLSDLIDAGTIRTVGGKTQTWTLSDGGAQSTAAHYSRDQGKTWSQLSAEKLLRAREMNIRAPLT